MTNCWVSQLVINLGFGAVWYRKLFVIVFKNIFFLILIVLDNYLPFVCIFVYENSPITPDQNVSIPLYHLCQFLENHRKLYMRTWYSLRSY